MRTATRRLGVTLAVCAALVAACSSSNNSGGGGSGTTAPPKMEPLSALGNGEGQLNLIAWAGYARTEPTTPRSTGWARSNNRPAARSTSRSATPPTRWFS